MKRTEARAVRFSAPGRTDGWMACANCCLCVAALLDSKLPKALSDACAPNGFSVFIGLLFCEPPSTYSTFSPVTFYSSRLVPHCRCLGCYAFYLKMTINFTLLFFLLICIQVTLLFLFCLCSYIRLLLLFFVNIPVYDYY